jgi:hypothetical protein
MSATADGKTKIRASKRGNFFIPPKKTSGLRCARPKKKRRIRATISVLVPIWWLCIPKLEPILRKITEPCRLSHNACAGKPALAPPEKPFDLFFEIPPPIFLKAKKGVFWW